MIYRCDQSRPQPRVKPKIMTKPTTIDNLRLTVYQKETRHPQGKRLLI
jgi:hypothetical protein